MKHKWEIITQEYPPEWNEQLMKEVTPAKEYIVAKRNTWLVRKSSFLFVEGIITFGCIMTWLTGGLEDEYMTPFKIALTLVGMWIGMSILGFFISIGHREEYTEDSIYSSMKKAIIKRDYLNSKEEKHE